jgi:hypothetical protein
MIARLLDSTPLSCKDMSRPLITLCWPPESSAQLVARQPFCYTAPHSVWGFKRVRSRCAQPMFPRTKWYPTMGETPSPLPRSNRSITSADAFTLKPLSCKSPSDKLHCGASGPLGDRKHPRMFTTGSANHSEVLLMPQNPAHLGVVCRTGVNNRRETRVKATGPLLAIDRDRDLLDILPEGYDIIPGTP